MSFEAQGLIKGQMLWVICNEAPKSGVNSNAIYKGDDLRGHFLEFIITPLPSTHTHTYTHPYLTPCLHTTVIVRIHF